MKADQKKVKRALDFKLTESEFADRGKRAANLNREIVDMKSEFDGIKKSWKGRIDAAQTDLDRYLRIIKLGVESRVVDCIEHKVYDQDKVEYIYDGEIMHERKLESHERQQELPIKKTLVKKKEVSGKEAHA